MRALRLPNTMLSMVRLSSWLASDFGAVYQCYLRHHEEGNDANIP